MYTFFLAVRRQVPYAIEYLTVEQTRDVFPGLETFVLQCMRTLFSKATNSITFIKAFYKVSPVCILDQCCVLFQGHNSISFLSASLELNKNALASLYLEANRGKSWESTAIECLYDVDLVILLMLKVSNSVSRILRQTTVRMGSLRIIVPS